MKYKNQYARFDLVEKGDARSCRVYLRMIAEYEYYFELTKWYLKNRPEEAEYLKSQFYLQQTAKKFCNTINYTSTNIASLLSLGEKRMRILEQKAKNVLK